jgi:hypothetical protein
MKTGRRAGDFASYMRIHALEAPGGVPFAQLPRYLLVINRVRETHSSWIRVGQPGYTCVLASSVVPE